MLLKEILIRHLVKVIHIALEIFKHNARVLLLKKLWNGVLGHGCLGNFLALCSGITAREVFEHYAWA